MKAFMSRVRTLGLTRPGGTAAGLGQDFVFVRSDTPPRPDRGEPGRDVPPEVMRQLCAQLDGLDEITSRDGKVAIELCIDTGRRPEEISALGWDCLRRDGDGHPVLVYDNIKGDRLGRRLPIPESTATLITGQQQRVRAAFPNTPIPELKLLPARQRNPDGKLSLGANGVAARHRQWVDSLPPLLTVDGAEFDKTTVVLYSYRHTYAQRHADAGVPCDVLRELMDHRQLDVTARTTGSGNNADAKPSTGSPTCNSTGTATAPGNGRKRCSTANTSAGRSAKSSSHSGCAPNHPTSKQAVMPAPTGSGASAAITSAPTCPTSPTCKPTWTTSSATAKNSSLQPISTTGRGPKRCHRPRRSPAYAG